MRWAAITAAITAILTAGAYVGSRRSATRRSPLVTLIAIAIGLTAFQLVPLPLPIARELIADKVEIVEANAQAWNAPAPSAVMASYDPPATLVELAKLCGYAALAFAATRLATHRRGRRALAISIVGAALAIAAVAIVHAAIGAHDIYGFFHSPVTPRLLTPIINDNHLASLMAMATPVALGLAISSAALARIGWLAAALVCAACALIISSRGGAIGLVAGVLVALAVLVAQRRSRDRDGGVQPFRREVIPQLVIAACVIVLLGALTASQVFGELAATHTSELSESHSKYQVWARTVDMLESNHWLGIGRGAFEPAFTRWSEVGDLAYSHAENSYLQTAIDWGLPGAMAIAIAGAFVVLAVLRRWRDGPIEAGALGALASIALHDLVDFSMELPVVAIMAIFACAILLPARIGTETDGGRIRPLAARTRWKRSLLLGVGVMVCVIAASPLGRPAHAEAAAGDGPDATLAIARAASNRHPADYLLLGRAAQSLMALGDARAVAVVGRALALNPTHSGLHRLAATLLAHSQHPAQARVEFALALRFAEPAPMRQILDEIVATYPDPEQAALALPLDLTVAAHVVADLLALHWDALDLAYTSRLAMLNPDDPAAQRMLARAALQSAHGDTAVAAARAAYQRQPSTESAIVLARAQALTGDAPGGIETLRLALAAANATRVERTELLSTTADLQLASGRLDDLSYTLDELAPVEPDTAGQIDLHVRRAQLDDRRGNANQANWERQQIRLLEGGSGP